MKKHHEEQQDFEPVEYTNSAAAGKHLFKGLLIGSLVGAATMLLFAPRSGEETRAELRDKALELRERTGETVKDTVSQAKSRAYELKENVWDRVADLKQRGKQAASEQLERVSQAAESGRQRVQEY